LHSEVAVAETIPLAGGSRLVWRGPELAKSVAAEWSLRLRAALEEIASQVKRNISSPSRPTPSAPGEFPHADTGMLRNSIFWTFDEKKMEGIVGTPLLYGLYLEYGTSGGQIVYPSDGSVLSWIDPVTGQRRFAKWIKLGRIEPRPFLSRTLKEMLPKIQSRFLKRLPDAGVAYGGTAGPAAA
jgi:hypothetical protein